jgi:hypothetical protein
VTAAAVFVMGLSGAAGPVGLAVGMLVDVVLADAAVTLTDSGAGGELTGMVDPGGSPLAVAVSLILPLSMSAWVTV